MRKIFFTGLLVLVLCTGLRSQSLRLDTCQALALRNYPLVKQYGLIEASGRYSIENAGKNWLPQVNLTGQASYQNEVVSFPETGMPNAFPVLAKDQYKLGAEISQLLFDGGSTHQEKALREKEKELRQAELSQQLYPLQERINQLFFGILLLRDQLEQNRLLQNDIEAGIRQASAAVENGTTFRSAVDELRAALLNARQHRISLSANRDAYLQVLGAFLQRNLDSNTLLERPAEIAPGTTIRRPELRRFELQEQQLALQQKNLHSRNLPSVSAFFNAYYGRPTFNIVSNDFGDFWIGGIRFSWNLGKQYTYKRDRDILSLQQQQTALQKESFLFNTRLDLLQDNRQVQQFREQVQNDREIIVLRESVKKAAAAQLENGVITSHDYLVQVIEDNQARINLSLHEIYLLKAIYQTAYHTGYQNQQP